MENRIRIGVSACLLGQPVRFDGSHKHDRYLTGTLGEYLEFVPVCPEVEAGFPIPRETFRLVGDPDSPRFVTTRTQVDHTARMTEWAEGRVRELEKENLCGFIFKSDSPSSGLERVKVYNAKGMAEKKGVGMFARAFTRHFPLLPVEEEGRLNDAKLRETFIEQIFTLKRWRETLARPANIKNLVDFHTRHKLLVLSHSPVHAQRMGKLVAGDSDTPVRAVYSEYETLLIEALRMKTTLKKNMNVLQHIMGYFKQQLSADEKQELLEVLDQYRREYLPLIVPVTLLNHYVRKYDQPYLKQQVYLNPHPIALKLRNHA
ncbi:MAG: DUF523 and DUF1722 domain-containing protein [Desulfobacterales bacterium]|jgi:uncharacterized protein YbgA (DUF1722 family)/uncharacterized protein YbbK (DUF523 family)|nr:DUF523 and DUF1722 domain-containing protein [Desulfobacterales bacterium]